MSAKRSIPLATKVYTPLEWERRRRKAMRKAATHSDASMTQRYSRNEVEDRAVVQRLRNERRGAA
jgi:hypothetical protein